MIKFFKNCSLKVKIISLIVTIVVLALIVVGTYAFLFRQQEIKNTFTLGDVEITLTQTDIDATKLRPGTTIEFDPTMTETKGESYARIVLEFLDEQGTPITDQKRVQKIRETLCYNTDGKIEAGKSYTASTMKSNCNFYSSISSNNYYIGFHYGESDTKTGFNVDRTRSTYEKIYFNSCYGTGETMCLATDSTGNGYILKQGGSMKLFTHIVIPSDWTSEDLSILGNFNLSIKAEAIQSSGLSAVDAYTALDSISS